MQLYDFSKTEDIYLFDQKTKWFKENKKVVEYDEHKFTRTDEQQKSRWLYLTMCATVLNDEGQTYTPPGTNYQIKWTKDLLYQIYWQTTRQTMYPDKKGQLNTKEFSDLVDSVMYLFLIVFELKIDFPDRKRIKEEPKY